MNIFQSTQVARSAVQLAQASRSPNATLGDVLGSAVGAAFAAQTSGLVPLASGIVGDAAGAVVDGAVSAGKAAAGYASRTIGTLGRVVDMFV
ncbi:hypothetical protein [Xylophilus sp.]|uniref:hypothetical protein n=1 Tax=Xylophilus sp. TaxID=2653893 RepID=UPI0013B97FF7|nr:hypothetical protein [Xylophilus sp.]KAF1045009.1 MAG: hypothetical protein GAK38_03235 [Xylophilus sp.]